MIKYETRSNFEYKCSFGTVIADKVRIAISDTNGEEFLPSEEIDRLTRMAIEKFYQENYAKLLLGERVDIQKRVKGYAPTSTVGPMASFAEAPDVK